MSIALYGLQMSVSLYELLVQSNMYDMWSQYDNAIRMLIGVSDNMTFRDLKSFVVRLFSGVFLIYF